MTIKTLRLLAGLLSALGTADFLPAQSFATAENARTLLRDPWTRGSTRFERRWQFLGPLTPAEIAAGPANLLQSEGPAAKRWINQIGYTDIIEVPLARSSSDPEASRVGVHALGRVIVRRSHAGAAILLLGADGGLEVFANGASVFRRSNPQPFSCDQEAVAVTLKEGDNDIILRLEHHSGPWRISLRVVEPGTLLTPGEEISPKLLRTTDPRMLSVQTHRARDSGAAVEVEVIAPGGRVMARTTGNRGDILTFATAAWEDGPYEVNCATEDGWGRRRYVHLPWYKGDAAAAARELVAAAAGEPAGSAGDHVRMLASLVQARLHDHPAAGPDVWRDVHSPLLEYRELLLHRAGKAGGDRAGGFVRLAYTDEIDGTTQFCRAYLPPNYDPEKRWPVVVFLHGFNPVNPAYIDWWSVDQRHNPEADRSPVILLEPHGRGNAQYRGIGEKDVLQAIAEAKRRFAVDDDRVYLTGESMGGHGVWSIASRHPDLFAAAAPVYGGWDFRQTPVTFGGFAGCTPANDAQRWLMEMQSSFVSAENLLNLPFFVHHGDIDQNVSVENSRYAVRLLERWGYDIRYEEHVGFGHEDLLSRGEIVDWLLTHRRVNAPRRVRLRAGDLGAASAYWVKVEAWEQQARLMEVDAEFIRPGLLRLDTRNVAALTLTPPAALAPPGNELTVVWNGNSTTVPLRAGRSAKVALGDNPSGLAKHAGLEGTISDVITTPFVIVVGTSSSDTRMRELCRQKAEAFAENWHIWQKQRPRIRDDRDLTEAEKRSCSLILIGGADANSVTQALAPALPLTVDATQVVVDGPKLACHRCGCADDLSESVGAGKICSGDRGHVGHRPVFLEPGVVEQPARLRHDPLGLDHPGRAPGEPAAGRHE